VTGPRAVRIPRSRSPPTDPGLTSPIAPTERRWNRSGTQRAVRTTLLYIVAVLLLTGVLTALDLSSAEANRPAVQQGLELFLGIAAALLVGSAVFALSPAPRYIEIAPDRVVVVGRWGGRRVFAPLPTLAPRVVKHFSEGILSSLAVDMVEIVDRKSRRRTYQVESGLFDVPLDLAPRDP
jgi:hypothetical protein